MRLHRQSRRIGYAAQLMVLLVIPFLCLAAQENAPHAAFDLRLRGYIDLPKDFKYLQFQLANGQVAFIDSDRVAVSFLVANKETGLTDREHLSGGRWLFHTVVISAHSGQLQAEWSWRTASPDSQFVPLQTGQFFVSSDERITLQLPDGKTLWQLDLPRTNIFPARPYGIAILSNTGKTLFVIADQDKDNETVAVYRTSDLRSESTFTIPYQSLVGRLAASDQGLIYMGKQSPDLIFTDRLGLHSYSLWTCESPWQCGLSPQFIGTDRLLFSDGLHSLLLLSDQGKLLQRRETDKEDISRVSVCSDGTRTMVMLLKMGGGSTFFDVFPKVKEARIAILEANTLREIANLPIDPKHLLTVRAGLNPTGDLVAYMDNGVLKFWHITSPPIAK